jgi:hypothetical protein
MCIPSFPFKHHKVMEGGPAYAYPFPLQVPQDNGRGLGMCLPPSSSKYHKIMEGVRHMPTPISFQIP